MIQQPLATQPLPQPHPPHQLPQPTQTPTTLTPAQQKNLQDEKRLSNIIKIQKNMRAARIRASLKEQFKRVNRRRKIIKQLIDTEEAYIRDLGFIVSDFKMRMQSRGILSVQEGRKLFANVDEIRQLHDIFFSTLYNHFCNYHPYLIIFADVLNSIFYFRIYIDYLNNFPAACDLVNQYKNTKPAFASFLAQIARSPQYRFLSIQDYMVKPVQRLPKYVLLLKQLIKNTHSSHPDYQNVKKALKQFQQVNNNNNQKLTKIRNSFKLRQLESMLQLTEGVITQSTEFILEETVQILSQENNQIVGNCVLYLLNSCIIVTRRYGTFLNRNSSNVNANSHAMRVNRVSGFNNTMMKEKLETIVQLKYGTSIDIIKDQCFYKNSFTVQSPQGQSCTFICANQQQLHNLYTKVKKQYELVVQQTINKLKTMFQGENINNNNSTFIKAIGLLDLVPEVTVLGTSERTDKMLKYTVYIVEVKIRMIRQKIFLRFSELLELEKFIGVEYGSKIEIKQGLVSSSWLNNHQQKTIEQRKMNIQRFLKEILSKPEVIQNGWRILLRLGLPIDFYELPQKLLESKHTDSFIKKNSTFRTSVVNSKKKNLKGIKNSSYRLSLFQQQKIQQQNQQQQQQQQPKFDQILKPDIEPDHPLTPTQSYITNTHNPILTIQDILKANEVDLGHYTRISDVSSSNQNENSVYNNIDKIDTMVSLEVLVPCLESLYSWGKIQGGRGDGRVVGFRGVTVRCSKLQRVQNVIPLVAKEIRLKYYKDFRLLIEKEYSQRFLDDDQLVHKLLSEISRTKAVIVLRKIIYIDHQIQQKQLIHDKRRLTVITGQIFNQIKMGKYRLNYESYLKFAVLSAIFFQQTLPANIKQQLTSQLIANLAKQAKCVIFPKYSTLSQTEDIWIKDFFKAYHIMYGRLKEIVRMNNQIVERERLRQQEMQNGGKEGNGSYGNGYNCSQVCSQKESSANLEYLDQLSEFSHVSNFSQLANTNIKFLTLLSIIKEIEKNQYLFGCVEFPVQINDQFKSYLQKQLNIEVQNQQIEQITKKSSKIDQPQRKKSTIQPQRASRNLTSQQNKNCWLQIRHDRIYFTQITKNTLLYQLKHQQITRIDTYSASLTLELRNMQIPRIKLKTTSSYYIREMLVYYRNYRAVMRKLCVDGELRESVVGLGREEGVEMDQYYL